MTTPNVICQMVFNELQDPNSTYKLLKLPEIETTDEVTTFTVTGIPLDPNLTEDDIDLVSKNSHFLSV